MRRTLVLALLAALALALPGAAEARTWHSSLKVRLPAKGHSLSFTRSMRTGKNLKGFFLWMQMRGPDGRLGPRIAPRRTTTLAEPDGHKYATLRLTARYNRRGRVRYTVRVRNLDVRGEGRKLLRIALRVTLKG